MGADAASSKPSRPNDSEIVVTSLVPAAGTRHARGLIKAMRLALLPTGEAVRPEEVRRIRIEPEPMVLEQEVRRYAVVIELADQPPWTLRSGLAFDDAVSLSRRCGQAVNEGLAPKE